MPQLKVSNWANLVYFWLWDLAQMKSICEFLEHQDHFRVKTVFWTEKNSTEENDMFFEFFLWERLSAITSVCHMVLDWLAGNTHKGKWVHKGLLQRFIIGYPNIWFVCAFCRRAFSMLLGNLFNSLIYFLREKMSVGDTSLYWYLSYLSLSKSLFPN